MSRTKKADTGQGWVKSVEKEAKVRSVWFRRNEERLNEIANQPPTRLVPDDVKGLVKQQRISAFRNARKYPRVKKDDSAPPPSHGVPQGVMKPVDPATTRLIYEGNNKDGRSNYLKERVKLLPEERYFFPEVSSFEYGWRMWDMVAHTDRTGFGRRQVIRDSFYRRRGLARDPDWYKEPAHIGATFCNVCS
ncbi:protein SPMIP1-like [Cylas formicarius]|uniref:protein SPMIP1-like n=1 Tax=Cylas formicarius TaxID=197179 RepID=UPI0029589316|nr:protein SPMIP1-like [Cylas formicarius]